MSAKWKFVDKNGVTLHCQISFFRCYNNVSSMNFN